MLEYYCYNIIGPKLIFLYWTECNSYVSNRFKWPFPPHFKWLYLSVGLVEPKIWTGHFVWRSRSLLSDIFKNRRTCPTWPTDFGKPGMWKLGMAAKENWPSCNATCKNFLPKFSRKISLEVQSHTQYLKSLDRGKGGKGGQKVLTLPSEWKMPTWLGADNSQRPLALASVKIQLTAQWKFEKKWSYHTTPKAPYPMGLSGWTSWAATTGW